MIPNLYGYFSRYSIFKEGFKRFYFNDLDNIAHVLQRKDKKTEFFEVLDKREADWVEESVIFFFRL